MNSKTGVQVSFTPLGFNPHTEQVCFVATVQGANGQETFNYSGGILAFIPQTKLIPGVKYGEKVEVKFDLWKTLEARFQRESGWHSTNIQSVLKAVRQGRIEAKKNLKDASAMRVFHAIASYAKPDGASLIYSLLSDAEADSMSFVQWCREFGYDDDSIKAESVYRACVDIARKLQRILSREQMEEMREIAAAV